MSLNKKYALYCIIVFLLLFIISIVYPFHSYLTWHDQQRLYQLILICIAGLSVFATPPYKVPSYAFITLLILIGLGIASSYNSTFPVSALKEWAHHLGLLIFAFIIAYSARQVWFLKALLYLLAAAAFLNAFQFFTYYLMAFATGILMFNADLLFNGFSNPRFLNQFQMLFMPILAYLALHHWQATHRHSKLLASIIFVTLLVQWCIAFSLGGRGLWLGLAVSHVALIIFFPRFWRLLAVQAAAGLLGFILFYLMFTVVPEWLGQTSVIRDSMRFGLSKREVIWQMAWDMFLANPWLGVGPMHFSAEVNSVAAHPHQVVLQWLAEWGIFATLAAIFIAVWGIFHGLRFIRSEKGQPLDAALWMSILGALALAQVDGVFVMPYTETWLAILIGLAMARWSKPSTAESRWQTYSLRILTIPVILILGNVLINEVPTLAQDSEAHMEKHGTGYTPRFWMQGWIPMDGK